MLADRYEGFLFDLDGVLFRGDVCVPGAPAVLDGLRGTGKRVVFMTNNSARTLHQVVDKLRGFGFRADADEVVSSAMVTAALLGERGVRTTFVVGEAGIRESLVGAGIEVLDGDPKEVDAVVVGWDRLADYPKLRRACLLVESGAALVATNADPAYPAPDGLWPGAGALLAVVRTTTGVEPEVVGKPAASMFLAARERSGGDPALVVGDRLDTDVAGAVGVGLDSLLVLTGVTRRADLEDSPIRPTYVGEDVGALLAERMPGR